MKSRKSPVYHIGDRVKIIKPEIFIRCGYPKTKADFAITPEQRNKLEDLLISFGIAKDSFLYYRYDNSLDRIYDEISYLQLAKANFGGNKREIHTTTDFNILNITGEVISKRTVKTGVYDYGYIDFEGNSNPPSLHKEQSHVILKIDVASLYSNVIPYLEIETEEKNVIKESNS